MSYCQYYPMETLAEQVSEYVHRNLTQRELDTLEDLYLASSILKQGFVPTEVLAEMVGNGGRSPKCRAHADHAISIVRQAGGQPCYA